MNDSSPAAPRSANKRQKGSLGADLLSASLDNPALCDVTLVGSDGGRVPAIRSILAARSNVLECLLVGKFKESKVDAIPMAYPSFVLRALVHYCCTDAVPPLSDMEKEGEDAFDVARIAVTMCAAAEYYELEGMQSAAEASLDSWACRNASAACAILDEALYHPSLLHVQDAALTIIRTFPHQPLLSKTNSRRIAGVTFLGPRSLLKLVQDDGLVAHAETLFRAVQAWAETTTACDDDMDDKEVEGANDINRLEIARACVAKLELRFFSPSELLTTVRDSGLVESGKILDVVAKQMQGGAVYVSNSSLAGANGLYELVPKDDDDNSDNLRFDKRGRFEGDDVTFTICTLNYVTTEFFYRVQRWHLFAPPKGASRILEEWGKDQLLYEGTKGPSDTWTTLELKASRDTLKNDHAVLHFLPWLTSSHNPI